jgi:hypothetical protein
VRIQTPRNTFELQPGLLDTEPSIAQLSPSVCTS